MADDAAVVEGSRPMEDGALYLLEERMETFSDSSWPFDSGSCTAKKVRLRGWVRLWEAF